MSPQPSYSVDEARELLPQIRATLLRLAVERRRLESGDAEDADDLRLLISHLESLGVVVRDLEAGLVDVPTLRDGEPAWLCWRLADPDIAFWHSTSEGFASRRPL